MGSLLEERGMALEERDEACACIKREMLETADDDAGATRGVEDSKEGCTVPTRSCELRQYGGGRDIS